LKTSSSLNQLKKIGLAYNQLSRAGREVLEKFNILQNINNLGTSKRINEIGGLIHGDSGIEALMGFYQLSKLNNLDLSDSNLTDRSAIAIANSEGLKGLFSLNLSGNRITDSGAKALADSENLGQLKKLNLNFNFIGDLGARAIAKSPYLANLKSLKLGQNRVGKIGAKALKESDTLVNLMHPIFGFY
jgi:Leucine-rich repeat (LRR) protein